MKEKKIRHINKEDRIEIDILLKKKYLQKNIAEVLGFPKGTISKEINRNKSSDGIYRWEVAEHKARVKRGNSKWQGMKIEKDKFLKDLIEKALKEKQSPEAISGRLKKEFNITISHTSIYKWIYSSNAQRNAQYLCFRRYIRKAQKRNRSKREMRRWILRSKRGATLGYSRAYFYGFKTKRRYLLRRRFVFFSF